MPKIQLFFDQRTTQDGAEHGALYRAALDMCEWADSFEDCESHVLLGEHHVDPGGFMPSPIVFASAIAGRTRRTQMLLILLLSFYNPVRLAEDLAILDLVSGGRVEFVFAAGYRPPEFEAFGVDPKGRGRLMEAGIEVLKAAWSGEEFEYQGRPNLVMPRPAQRPRPPIVMAGSSLGATKRAARIADAYYPTQPGLTEAYREALLALGKDPTPARNTLGLLKHNTYLTGWRPSADGEPPSEEDMNKGSFSTLIAVSEDPDKAWARMAPLCVAEGNIYARWHAQAFGHDVSEVLGEAPPFKELTMADADGLRESGRYLVLTPDECVELAREYDDTVTISPLIGGIDPKLLGEVFISSRRRFFQN